MRGLRLVFNSGVTGTLRTMTPLAPSVPQRHILDEHLERREQTDLVTVECVPKDTGGESR